MNITLRQDEVEANMVGCPQSPQSDFLGQYLQCYAIITDIAPAITQMLINFCEHYFLLPTKIRYGRWPNIYYPEKDLSWAHGCSE